MDEDQVKTLFLELVGAKVMLQGVPAVTWDRNEETFFSLLGPYAPKYTMYDGSGRVTVRLRVRFPAPDPPNYNIWSLQHPEGARHLFDCYWTIAEFLRDAALDASFRGLIQTDDDHICIQLQKVFSETKEVHVERVPDLRLAADDALIIAHRDYDPGEIGEIREHASRPQNGCRIIIWTRTMPGRDGRDLIEFYPGVLDGAHAPTPDLWLGTLVRHLAKGLTPEDALRDVFRATRTGLVPGSIRLRNGASDRWTSFLYAGSYYRRHVDGIVRKSVSASRDGRVRVIVCPARAFGVAKKATANLLAWLKEARDEGHIEVVSPSNAREPDPRTFAAQCKRALATLASDYAEEDHEPRPLWVLHLMPSFDDPIGVIRSYVEQVSQMSCPGTSVYLCIVVEAYEAAVRTALEPITRTRQDPGDLVILPQI